MESSTRSRVNSLTAGRDCALTDHTHALGFLTRIRDGRPIASACFDLTHMLDIVVGREGMKKRGARARDEVTDKSPSSRGLAL